MQEKKENPQILDADKLALILNISKQTVIKLAKEKELPCDFVNRRPHFKWNVLVKHFQALEGGAA